MSERFFLYNPPISPEFRSQYERALDKEIRWKNGDTIASQEPESDLQHVIGMFDLHGELEGKCPTLVSELDGVVVEDMIYVHDAGEILTHDLSHLMDNYDQIQRRWKRRERAAFRMLTRDYIGDIELRAYVRQLFERYEGKAEHDKESHYVHLLDKFQATKFGIANVFPGSRIRTRHERQVQLNRAFELFSAPVIRLYPQVGASSQSELVVITDELISGFERTGYGKVLVDHYRAEMQQRIGAL